MKGFGEKLKQAGQQLGTQIGQASQQLGKQIEKQFKPHNKDKQDLLLKLSKTKDVQADSIEKLISEGADPFLKDENGISAFDYILKSENLALLHKMYQGRKSKNLEQEADKLKALSLKVLFSADSKEKLDSFIDLFAVSKITELNSEMLNMLMQRENSSLEKVELLLKNGADPYYVDGDRKSAFEQASATNNLEAMHSMYRYCPDKEDALPKLEARTLAHLITFQDNIEEFNKIFLLAKDSGLKLEEKAEELMFEEGMKYIPQANIDLNVSGRRATLSAVESIKATPENIQSFSSFIDGKPLLGSDITSNQNKCFAKKALDFALDHFKTNPELLDKVISLIKEQNPKNSKLTQEITERLVKYSNENIPTLSSALQMDSIIKTYGGKVKKDTYILESLSSNNRETLNSIAILSESMEDKKAVIDGSISKDHLIQLHKLAQDIQDVEIPKSIRKQLNAIIISATDTFIGKKEDELNVADIQEVIHVAFKTKYYTEHVKGLLEIEKDSNLSDLQILEHRHSANLINALGNEEKIDLNKFAELIEKKPPLGDLERENSLGIKSLKIVTKYAVTNPDLLGKVTSLFREKHELKEKESYDDALKILNGKLEGNTQKEVENFINFLSQKPLPYLGDPKNEKSLARVIISIGEKNPGLSETLYTKTQYLVEHNPDILATAAEYLIETANQLEEAKKKANQQEIEKQKEIIIEHLTENLRPQLKFDNAQDVNAVMDSATKVKHNKLLSTIILENTGNINAVLDYNSVNSLFKEGYKDAVKALLYDPKAISHYVKQASELETKNDELLQFIYNNKGNNPIALNNDTLDVLINTGLRKKDTSMVARVLEDAIETKEENLIKLAVEKSFKNPLSEVNSLVKGVFSDDSILSKEKEVASVRDIVAEEILKDKEIVKKLDKSAVDSLVPFYDPSADSKEFLYKLLDNHYSKGATKEEFANSVKLSMVKVEESKIKDNANFNAAFNTYFDTRKKQDKSPILTMFKAWFSGKSVDTYKKETISSTLEEVTLKLKDCISPREKIKLEVVSNNDSQDIMQLSPEAMQSVERIRRASSVSSVSSVSSSSSIEENKAKEIADLERDTSQYVAQLKKQESDIVKTTNRESLFSKITYRTYFLKNQERAKSRQQ